MYIEEDIFLCVLLTLVWALVQYLWFSQPFLCFRFSLCLTLHGSLNLDHWYVRLRPRFYLFTRFVSYRHHDNFLMFFSAVHPVIFVLPTGTPPPSVPLLLLPIIMHTSFDLRRISIKHILLTSYSSQFCLSFPFYSSLSLSPCFDQDTYTIFLSPFGRQIQPLNTPLRVFTLFIHPFCPRNLSGFYVMLFMTLRFHRDWSSHRPRSLLRLELVSESKFVLVSKVLWC